MRYTSALLCAFLSPTIAAATVSFHGISVGQSVSTLPFKCVAEYMCDGLVEGNHVFVFLERDLRVSSFYIAYEQSKMLTTRQFVPAIPITLAQALKLHSMQDGASAPKLGYAKGKNGAIIIADIENRIAYVTSNATLSSASLVRQVDYLSSSDILKEAKQMLLEDSEAASILAEARTAPVYPSISAAKVSQPDPAPTHTFEAPKPIKLSREYQRSLQRALTALTRYSLHVDMMKRVTRQEEMDRYHDEAQDRIEDAGMFDLTKGEMQIQLQLEQCLADIERKQKAVEYYLANFNDENDKLAVFDKASADFLAAEASAVGDVHFLVSMFNPKAEEEERKEMITNTTGSAKPQ